MLGLLEQPDCAEPEALQIARRLTANLKRFVAGLADQSENLLSLLFADGALAEVVEQRRAVPRHAGVAQDLLVASPFVVRGRCQMFQARGDEQRQEETEDGHGITHRLEGN